MKPIIGITVGDYNGVGPEVGLKAALSPVVRRICRPVLIGPLDIFDWYARRCKLKVTLREVKTISPRAENGTVEVLTLWQYHRFHVMPGKEMKEAGTVAGEAITLTAELAIEQRIDAMVTAPVSKHTMNLAGFNFPGQTEMLAGLTQSKNVMMMLMAGKFRVGLATVHLALRDVSKAISKELVLRKIRSLDTALRTDLAVRNPRIAMLGVNPHAGENGMLGNEEQDVLIPAMHAARSARINIDGPFPADGFFGRKMHERYDAVLAMYHDQGLIPLKLADFDHGVNFSSGLTIVRTSSDHGTAFDIAGKNTANPASTIAAIQLAVDVVKRRKQL